MVDFLVVAQALGIIEKYFNEEVFNQDFLDIPSEAYSLLEEKGEKSWFMIDPKKLKEKYRVSGEALIVSESEKNSLLKAFVVLGKYSETLPHTASLKERLLFAKSYLPPVFFDSQPHNSECRIIPFQRS